MAVRPVRLAVVLVLTLAATAAAQRVDRDAKVRGDREAFRDVKDWIYNDLTEGEKAARASGKPLMVVFRCIPCEACAKFDDDVARRDPVIRDLLDRFVCVRIVQANTIDLTRFRYDFDQSFAVAFLNADGTLYGRFGTRSERLEPDDMALEGLRAAMEGALKLHAAYDEVKPSLAGKQVRPGRYRTPRDYPSLGAKFGTTLNYEGKVAQSCMHCHQVREAERLVYRDAKQPIPDDVLFPDPDPSRLGLKMDPKAAATVKTVAPGSPADAAGLRPGDRMLTLAGQPLLSVADIQWVLHNAGASAELPVRYDRGGAVRDATVRLAEGWRRGDISWRVTTWDLRRMGFGGMKLEDLTDARRQSRGLPNTGMALLVRNVGQFGGHAVAMRAGFRANDLITSFDGLSDRMTETEVLAHALQKKRPGDVVKVKLVRNGEPLELSFALQ